MKINLGNKEVNISPWLGKTKKEFVRLFKDKKENVTEDEVMNALVIPYIDNVDQYYSADEIQYLLSKIREISIKDNIKFAIECEGCKEEIIVDAPISEVYSFTPSKFPITIDDVEWGDLPKFNTLKKAVESYPEERASDLNLLLHIKSYKGLQITSLGEIIDIVDNLDIESVNKISDDFSSIDSKFEIGMKIECLSCKYKKKYFFDIIPSFFDPILPKD